MVGKRKPPALALRADLGLTSSSGLAASAARIALLEQVEQTGSITAAAKAVGLSYKAAWDAIAAMNNLADQPLVEGSVGGKHGGGTRLTARGRELITSFRVLEAEHRRFLESLNTAYAQAGGDLPVLRRMAMRTSARNQFSGRITRLTRGAVNDEVEMQLSGGDTLVATVTHGSSESLQLVEGGEVVALIKASAIIVAVDDGAPLRLSARNQLRGTVTAVQPGAVNSEIVIALGGGNVVVAIITNGSAEALALREACAVYALFKASAVILATPA
ncbi:TOBE domain-containing protein [Solimonas marina]|uniref:TOBE domain-containing protein n=1 Tax=Solimonas marina TaxID=2714601 RepID=A0A969W9X0_9GAMM|nr:TOBE domain-containing protein [Solimonas marina]NKF23456.1 TOBE domain-containing protein [Solimonas marina]